MDREKLIENLNRDLAAEYAAIIQYLTYAGRVAGPHRPTLKAFFLSEVPDETGHAIFLANKIASLGGEPTTEATPVAPAADETEMLERIAEAERRAIDGYTARAREAEELGDLGLKTALENMVQDETEHLEEVQKILGAGTGVGTGGWHGGSAAPRRR
ncbi:MAG: ferritin-like domain-containing protein [Phycisphaerales bacterium]